MSHTPVPWRMVQGEYVAAGKSGHEKIIAGIMKRRDPEEARSNLHLMTASPELLAVVEQLTRAPNCWCEAGIGNPMVPNHTELCKAAGAAVRKARGL